MDPQQPAGPASDRHVVVVGGGITGLATAHALLDAPERPQVTVLEADTRVGGKIRTSPFAGLPAVDEAADAYLTRVPSAVALVRRLGLGDQLTHPATAAAAVWHGGLHPIPEGLVLGVPTGLAALARSDLLSWRGKLRAGLEPLLPATDPGDRLGAWIRARFGDEVHERLVDPLVGSIYAADTDQFSLEGMPQLASLAGGRSLLLAARRARSAAPAAHGPVFEAPRAGMGALVDALAGSVRARGGTIRTGTTAASVERADGRYRIGVDAGDGGPSELHADAVVLTSPARATAPLLARLSPDVGAALARVEHASVVMVALAVPAEVWPAELTYSGYLVPKPDQRAVTAVSFASNKWAHWRPDDGSMVLRVSLGRHGLVVDDWDDDRLVDQAVTEVGHHLGIDLTPRAVRVTRWPAAFAQYRPGHLGRVDAMERVLAAAAPGVLLAGASHRGIGIPACVQQAERAAGLLRQRLGSM
jgi:oxygen-dependent protoporphyrinogen oxidase